MGDTWLHRWFAAGDAGDVDAFDELLAVDVVAHAPLGLSTEGIEAEKQVWREAVAAMPDIRHEIQEVWESPGGLAARVVVTGTHQGDFGGIEASGRRFEIDQAVFVRLVDGKASEIWEIIDSGALRRQLEGDVATAQVPSESAEAGKEALKTFAKDLKGVWEAVMPQLKEDLEAAREQLAERDETLEELLLGRRAAPNLDQQEVTRAVAEGLRAFADAIQRDAENPTARDDEAS